MRSFFIGLQFLTRISIVHQENWTVEDFGRSVKSFPLVGAVLGACYALVAYCLCIWLPTLGWEVPRHLSSYLRDPALPQGAKIVLFAGAPKMEDVFAGRGHKWYRRIGNIDWLRKAWQG